MRAQDPTTNWELLNERDQSLWASKAVAHQGGNISDVLHAVEKPWNYRDEVQDYWKALLAEEKQVST